ncbi:MAG: hypothetical protein AAGA80_16535 [Cyanobacteria bacterium P01_F01_bin.143]
MTIPHYPDLGSALRDICFTWCQENGYTDPFLRDGEWWAFPPNGVMPVKVKTVMEKDCQRTIKITNVTLKLFPDGSLG